jgi:hypothetical protein
MKASAARICPRPERDSNFHLSIGRGDEVFDNVMGDRASMRLAPRDAYIAIDSWRASKLAAVA